MSTTLYIVMREEGEYSHRYVTPVAVFHDEEMAQAFCDKASAQRDAAIAAFPILTGEQWTQEQSDQARAARRRAWETAIDRGCWEDARWNVEEAPLLEQVP